MNTDTILGINIWFVVKIFTLILLGMYLIYAFVVVRQVRLMTDTLHLGNEGFVKLLGYAHMIFAVFVFLAALVIL